MAASPEPNARKPTLASVHLDSIRAIAALIVLVCHWRNLLFLDANVLHGVGRVLLAPMYVMADAAPPAVIVFFVLSGYLVSGSVLRAYRRGTFSLPVYGVHRLARLWVVLLPALALGGLLDGIGTHMAAAHALYAGRVANHVSVDVFDRLRWQRLVQCLLFLQTIRGEVWGSNVALWSLAYEFWYYVLFPLGFLVVTQGTLPRARVAYAAGFVAVAWLAGPKVMAMFLLWLLGFAVHWMPPLRTGRAMRVCAAAVYAGLFGLLVIGAHSVRGVFTEARVDAAVGVLTAALVWTALSATQDAKRNLYTRTARGLAGFSYTLYAVHFPILMLFTAYVLGDARWAPTGAHLAEGSVGLVLALGSAYGLHALFEARTPVVQQWAEAVVRRAMASVSGPSAPGEARRSLGSRRVRSE